MKQAITSAMRVGAKGIKVKVSGRIGGAGGDGGTGAGGGCRRRASPGPPLAKLPRGRRPSPGPPVGKHPRGRRPRPGAP